MKNLLLIIAVVLIILWLLGYFTMGAGNLIHILAVIALVLIIIRLVRR